jgi:hypothetical protein
MYRLKREFGLEVTVQRYITDTYNLDSGSRKVTCTGFTVVRAIVLPAKLLRQFESDSQKGNFSYGAYYDASTREVIIDYKDIPDSFIFKKDDWLVFNNQRWNIADVQRYEDIRAFHLRVVAVSGAPRNKFVAALAETNLTVASSHE